MSFKRAVILLVTLPYLPVRGIEEVVVSVVSGLGELFFTTIKSSFFSGLCFVFVLFFNK